MLTRAGDVLVFNQVQTTARAHLSGGCAGVQPSALDKNKRPFVFENSTCSLERGMCRGSAECRQQHVLT